MKVGVLGATGYIGGRLVPELLAAGHEVVCVARSPEKLAPRSWIDDVEVRRADALDADSLAAAVAGVDVVYHLVHSMGDRDDFADAERKTATNVRDAAETSGVSHVIYLGGLGDDDDPELSPHLRSRHEVGRIIGAGTVPTTELRAAIIIGSGSASFEMLRSLVEVLPVMITPRWVNHTLCQPIGIADVLHFLVATLDHVPDGFAVYDVGGPEIVTYRQTMDRYATIAGLPRRVILPVPVLTPLLSSHWINIVTPLPIDLARPLIESQVNDVVVRPDHDIRQIIDHAPLGLGPAIGRALHKVRDLEIRTRWTDSSSGRSAEPYPGDPEWSGGTLLVDERSITTTAPPNLVFEELRRLGGHHGWHSFDWAWRLRGLIDTLIGGPGMRRGRRHAHELRVGDTVDFFRVEALEDCNLLRLRAEMKVPGEAWLEWEVTETGTGSLLRQRALFHPRGLLGRLYWYAILPVHARIFDQLLTGLALAAAASTDPDDRVRAA
jgi:uncharacterized protein YbjT (DUF2867 family)